jgi:hypothetical protein
MLVRFTKNSTAAGADLLTCVRPDGSSTSAAMPRQGILPQAAFHFIIESGLGWHDALFGQVARGSTLEEYAAKIAGGRTPKMVQALQTESLVECLQTEQWSGAADPAGFAAALIAGCRRRGVPPPDVTADEVDAVRKQLRELGAAWRPLAPGSALERTF